jgi:indolepyruvate ferredoxin oxidoreductase
VVGASPEALQSLTRGRTRVAANLHQIPTAAFVADADADLHAAGLLAKIRYAIGTDAVASCDAQDLAAKLLGDTITANVLLLGFAWQLGMVPLGRAAIERALALNAVEVEANRLAFSCGRLAAADPRALRELLGEQATEEGEATDLDAIVGRACRRLTRYQDSRCSGRYARFVAKVRAAEQSALGPGAALELARQVAIHYARLLAGKDEYEIARMYSDGSLERALGAQFSAWKSVQYHFAPEFLVREGAGGRPLRKIAFGGWLRPALGLLARARVLRGTPLDPFGWSAARREERALAGEYAAAIERLLPGLDPGNHASAVRIAALPAGVRGFGSVRRGAMQRMKAEAQRLGAEWR